MATTETALFKWEIFDDIIVGIASPGQLSDKDWEGFLGALKTPNIKKYIQYTPGSTQMSSVQRKMGIDVVQQQNLEKVIMITDSALVRGVVTAASWFGIKVSSWRPTQLEEAIAELALPADKHARLIKRIKNISDEMM